MFLISLKNVFYIFKVKMPNASDATFFSFRQFQKLRDVGCTEIESETVKPKLESSSNCTVATKTKNKLRIISSNIRIKTYKTKMYLHSFFFIPHPPFLAFKDAAGVIRPEDPQRHEPSQRGVAGLLPALQGHLSDAGRCLPAGVHTGAVRGPNPVQRRFREGCQTGGGQRLLLGRGYIFGQLGLLQGGE